MPGFGVKMYKYKLYAHLRQAWSSTNALMLAGCSQFLASSQGGGWVGGLVVRVFGGKGGWYNTVSHSQRKSQVTHIVVSTILPSCVVSVLIKASCHTSNQS